MRIHETPVASAIRFITKKEPKTTARPSIAYVRVFRAPSSCLGSPPEVIYLKPEMIIKNKATMPAKERSTLIMF